MTVERAGHAQERRLVKNATQTIVTDIAPFLMGTCPV